MSAVPQAEQPILLREDRDGVCTLTMNRPQQMNLLTGEMLTALQKSLDEISRNREIRVVVIAGSGKGFCAGHDLKEIKALKELPKIEALFNQCSRMMQTIPTLPQPVIAKVHGAAAAAGCQLVAQCDLAIASVIDPRGYGSRASRPRQRPARPRGEGSRASGDRKRRRGAERHHIPGARWRRESRRRCAGAGGR